MSDNRSNILADLARAKALFQQKTLLALLKEQPAKSKPEQEHKESG